MKHGRHPAMTALLGFVVPSLLCAALCDVSYAQDVDVLVPCALAFECASDVELANATLSWKFSFNPRRAALYDIIQWTVVRPGKRPRRFVAQIGSHWDRERYVRGYRVYEHVRKRNWKRLWLTRTPVWRELEWGSPEHARANLSIRRLLGIARALRRGVEPSALTF